ncbi:hypothetical protein RSAG8_05737, partial [Rhizoctonia solani AG-8 WAC10335]
MSHWELKPRGTQSWVECLNEWSDKVGANITWHYSSTQGSTQTWRALPEINGQWYHGCVGEGGSRDAAKNAAAIALNRNRVLWRN